MGSLPYLLIGLPSGIGLMYSDRLDRMITTLELSSICENKRPGAVVGDRDPQTFARRSVDLHRPVRRAVRQQVGLVDAVLHRIFFASMSAFGLSGSQTTPASDAGVDGSLQAGGLRIPVADVCGERRHGEQRYGHEERQDRDIAALTTTEEQDSVLSGTQFDVGDA